MHLKMFLGTELYLPKIYLGAIRLNTENEKKNICYEHVLMSWGM